MANYFLKLIFLTIATFGLSKAIAQQVQLGTPTMLGDGCPAGTAVAVLSPTNDTISILFSAFQVEKQTHEVTQSLVKNCKIVLPVTVAAGYDLTAYQLDYRGYLHIEDPKGSFLFRSMPMVNSKIPGKPKDLYMTGTFDGPLEFSHYLDSYRVNKCGGQFNIQFELTLGLYGESRGVSPAGTAIATVDSADGVVTASQDNGVHLRFGVSPCQQAPMKPGWPNQGGPRPGFPGGMGPGPRPPMYPNYPPVYQPIPQPRPQPPMPQPIPQQPAPRPVPQPIPQPAPQPNVGQCYLNRYPDICMNSPKNYCKDPAKHYREHGQMENRVWGCQ